MTAADRPGILMVTGAYYPELSGGGLQCKAIVEALKDDARFAVLTTSTDPALPADDRVDGVDVKRVYVDAASRWSKLRALWTMTRAFAPFADRCDIVHLHGFSQKTILVIVLARLWRKRVVMTLHTAGQDEPDAVRRFGALAPWAFSRIDLYLPISQPLADGLAAASIHPSRICRVLNGLDVERFRPADDDEKARVRRALGLPADGAIVLFVGLFTLDKGPQLLYDAWRRATARAGDRSSLVYVGATVSRYYEVDESLAADIRTRAERDGVSARVRFEGETRTIEDYYRAADLFVFPTRREAFGMVLVEAMASGLACIASRIPGVTDEIVADGDTGLLVPPHDVDALASAMTDLLTDAARAARLGRAARASVVSRFPIARTARLTLDAYRRVLASAPAAFR